VSGAPIEPASPATPSPSVPPATTTPQALQAFELPDITARPISVDELTAMLPIAEQGPATTGDRTTTGRTNEDLITAAVLDRNDEATDIDQHQRVTGVAATYPSATGTAHVWIDLFETAEGAAGWIADTAGDIVKQKGGSHQASIDLTSASEYPIAIGEGSIGLILRLDGGRSTETVAMFHYGRVAVFTSIVRAGSGDLRVPVQYLAEDAAGRILGVLTEVPPAALASIDPLSYAFSFERTVEIGDERWTASASGTVAGDAVACTVSLNHPSLKIDRDLISADGRLWARDGPGRYQARSAAGAIDRHLLAMCPAWPVDPGAAGLADLLIATPARHDAENTAVLGYRGTGADLEMMLGLSPLAATVQAFDIWVATDTGWMVVLDLRLTGEASKLTQLIGVGFPEDASVTVTISQTITAIGEAGTINPPG